MHQAKKQLRWRWTPSLRIIKHYHTAEEKKDIQHNDAVDKLAKVASQLPLPEALEGGMECITICNRHAHTAKKWIMEYRHESTRGGTHWRDKLVATQGNKTHDLLFLVSSQAMYTCT